MPAGRGEQHKNQERISDSGEHVLVMKTAATMEPATATLAETATTSETVVIVVMPTPVPATPTTPPAE